MSEYQYDLFVIGAGSGGVRACRIAASLGAKVAVAEERYFGGTCVNVGCVPKKLYSYAAHYRDDLEDSKGFGWNIATEAAEKQFNWKILKQNKDNEINRLKGIYKSILDNNRVTVFEDRARLVDAHTVAVGGSTYTARYILLAVGGWPWIPDYPGNELAMDSNDVFEMEELPESIVVVGGGYIAVEFASIFARLGTETTLVYRGEQLLRGFDSDVRQFIGAEMARHMRLVLNDDVVRIDNNNKELKVTLKSGNEIECAKLLSATGRRPLTADLGLENVNIELASNGAIVVDDEFQTTVPSIYAVGDVTNRVQLTPVAIREGHAFADTVFGNAPRTVDYQSIPTAVFSSPPLAGVGLTEDEARAHYGDSVKIFRSDFRPMKNVVSGRMERGLYKMVTAGADERVVGLHLIGPDSAEILQAAAIAVKAGLTKQAFDDTVALHPSMAEELVLLK